MRYRNQIVFAVVLVVVGSLIWFGTSKDHETAEGRGIEEVGEHSDSGFASTESELAGLSLEREKEKNEVFRRAFWRNPSPEDTIRHAERREWSSASGVQRWDWFIAVDASEELTTYLLEQNAFHLIKITEQQTFVEVPQWFPKASSGFDLHQSSNGEMTILFNPTSKQVYAKSEGRGFRSGTQEPAIISSRDNSLGRLPNEAPPNPEE